MCPQHDWKDTMRTITEPQLQKALLHVCDLVVASEPMLTELDSIIGDGDHGTGMRDGFSELKANLAECSYDTIYDLLRASGMQLVKTMGGASGVIFGTLFIGGYEVVDGKAAIDADDLLHFFEESARTISRRGRCQAGDKTMLDALLAAIDAMRRTRGESAEIDDLLNAAYRGALDGVEQTKTMTPRRGRSKNFREKAVGYADPGAVSVSIIFKGLSEGIVL